jgi:hypothetical protein
MLDLKLRIRLSGNLGGAKDVLRLVALMTEFLVLFHVPTPRLLIVPILACASASELDRGYLHAKAFLAPGVLSLVSLH